MHVKVLTIEKHRDKNLSELEGEYLKRLSRHAKVSFENIKRGKIKKTDAANKVLEGEAAAVLEKLDKKDFLVVLDVGGMSFSSEEFAEQIQIWMNQGISNLVFFIGGPLGIDPSLKERAQITFSLSRLTFTHEMARMLLCEVLYRAFDIIHNGNYHK